MAMHNTPKTTLSDLLPEDVIRELKQIHKELSDLNSKIRIQQDVDSKRRYSISESAEYLGLSEATINRRISLRKILALKDGGRRFVMGAELLRYSSNPRR